MHRPPCAALSVCLVAFVALSLACDAQPPDTALRVASSRSAVVTTYNLFVLNEAGTTCIGKVQGFLQCILTGTNFSRLALTYPAGQAYQLAKVVTTSGAPCGNLDFQCAVNVGGFNVQPFDAVLIIYPSATWAGENGQVNVQNPYTHKLTTVNDAFIYSVGNNCDVQTVLASHELFEQATDGVSADCCNGQIDALPAHPADPHACFVDCPSCPISTCRRYAYASCTGFGDNSLGIASLTCGGQTYKYQRLSPYGHEFDGTCDVLSPSCAGTTCGSRCCPVGARVRILGGNAAPAAPQDAPAEARALSGPGETGRRGVRPPLLRLVRADLPG